MAKPPEILKLEIFYNVTFEELTPGEFKKKQGFRSEIAAFCRNPEGKIGGIILRGKKIKDVSGLASLTALTQLELNDNQVSDVSPLASLTALTQLGLNNNQVSDVSPLASLTALTKLWLFNNQVSDVSPLASLTALNGLWLSYNQVSDVSPLASLTALTRLWLSNNQVSDVSPLASLTALTLLGLENNQVTDIAPLIHLFRGELKEIELGGNPLSRPPMEIAQKGPKAIVTWFQEEKVKSPRYPEAKVLLVGSSGSGKTALIRSLLEKPLTSQEPPSVFDVTQRTYTFAGGDKVTVHFEELGEMPYATYPFFISRCTLYLLVLDSRKSDGSGCWLNLIMRFSMGSPVLVVFTHSDVTPATLDHSALKGKCPRIQGFYPVSNKNGDGVAALQQAITSLLPRLTLIQTPSWQEVKFALENLKEPTIDYDRYRDICHQHGVRDKNQNSLLADLNDLGAVFHDPELEWMDTLVLQRKWLVESVQHLLTHPQLKISKGLMRTSELPKLLPQFPKDKLAFLTQVMVKYEICHPIGLSHLFFPELLPSEKPELPFDDQTALRFEVQYDFLPPTLLPRLMVQFYNDILAHPGGSYQWREGVLFEQRDLDSQALVLVDYERQQLSIQTNGPHQQPYLNTLVRYLRELHTTYWLNAQEQVSSWEPKRLQRLGVAGFKSLRELEDLTLRDLNLLIGANGVGKSNFLQLLRLMVALARENLQSFILTKGGAEQFLYNGPQITAVIHIDLEFTAVDTTVEAIAYQLELRPAVNNTFLVTEKSGPGAGPFSSSLEIQRYLPNNPRFHVQQTLARWMIYHFHDTSDFSPMRREEILEDHQVFREDGRNIAPYLLNLKTNPEFQPFYQEIVQATRLVIPFFDDFRLDVVKYGETQKVKLSWQQKGSDFPMLPHHLSDGSIRFICLATALLQPTPPPLLVIDEPELGLHPSAIVLLAELIAAAAQQTQVIITTQSPLLIDQFAIEDLVVVNRQDGQSSFTRLQPADFDEWLKEYSVGELWTKNVIEGGTRHE